MGLFSRHTYNIGGNAKRYEFDRNMCGANCPKCHNGDCTKALGHSTISGHFSSGGDNGCGHRWDD